MSSATAATPPAPLDDSAAAMAALGALVLAADATIAQMTIERRVIIRVPIVPLPAAQRPATIAPDNEGAVREVAGPRCIALASIGGALVSPKDGVTLFAAQQQLRAQVAKSCRPADFYAGFYLTPSPDGALCARRDALHARSGATCRIERFRRVVPAR